MKTMRTTAAAALLALAASAAQALPAVQAEFRLNYYPPNPCMDLGSPTLTGLGSLFLDGSLLNRGAPAAPLACINDGVEASFAIGIGAPMSGELAFEFAGEWGLPDGAAQVFAMAAVEPGPPVAAPRIVIGRFDGGLFVPGGASEWQLVAYPGSEANRSGVDLGGIGVAVVPEPATSLMLAAGLLALAVARGGMRPDRKQGTIADTDTDTKADAAAG